MTKTCRLCGQPIMLVVLVGWVHYDLTRGLDHAAQGPRL